MNWKDNKNLQAVVGLIVFLLGMWWLFGPDLKFAVATFADPPSDNPKALPTFSAIWPVILDILVSFFAGLGAYVFKLGDLIWSKIHPTTTPVVTTPEATTATPDNVSSLIQGLAQAVATNDDSQLAKFKAMIRRPYAKAELIEAIDKNDTTTAQRLFTELTGETPKGK